MNLIRAAAVGLFSALIFTSVWVAAPATAVPADSGVDRFGGCIAGQKSGQLLLMIDESGSLQDTDPRDDRVAAAKYLVGQLAQFAKEAGIDLQVAVAGFSDMYRHQLGWTRLTDADLAAVDSSIDAFRDQDSGQDTDYWLALDGARATLANAPRPSEGKRCQALAWFTDGKLDYSPRANADKPYAPGRRLDSAEDVAATAATARDSICRDRGLADQLRSSGVITFAIGLSPDPGQVADFDLLKAIATGQPTGAISSCGAVKSPAPGDFFLAQNIEDLLFAFDAFSTPGQTPTQFASGACARVICEEAKHQFVLDRSVRTVSVLAAADRPGLVPNLVAPDGTAAALDEGPATIDVGGVTVDYRPEGDRSVSFRMSGSSVPQWQGAWALVFVDPTGDASAKTRSSIHISGDLYPAWPDAAVTTVHSGDGDAPATFSLVDSRQQHVDAASLLGQAALSVTFIDASGGQHPLLAAIPKDLINEPQSLDLNGVPPGAGTLQLVLDITTADATTPQGAAVPGTLLAPQRVDLPLTVAPPVGYPTVGDLVDFGSVEGAGTFSTSLLITGQGCAWLAEPQTAVQAAPDGVGDVALTSTANSADTCVKSGNGQPETLPVDIAIPAAANGAINGTVTVMAAPSDGTAEPIPVTVPFNLELAKPLDAGITMLTLVIALILGPGIPLLLLYLAKYLVTRIPARSLRAEAIPVRVTGGTVSRDGRPFAVRDGELVHMVAGLDKPARRLQVGPATLQTRIGWSPFGAGYVVASAPGRVGAAGRSGATRGKTPDAKLPLAVHNTWFVLHDLAGPPDAATVVLLVSGDADRPRINTLTDEVSSSLPRILPQLRAKAVSAESTGNGDAGATSDNPFADSTPVGQGSNPFAAGTRSAGSNPFTANSSTGEANPFGGAPTPASSNPFGSAPPAAGGRGRNPFDTSSSGSTGPPTGPTDGDNRFK